MSNHSIRRLLLGCFIALPSTLSQALTVEESLAAAIDNSPGLHEQFAKFQGGLELQDEAQAEYFPQVSLRAAIGPEKTNYRAGQEVDADLTREEVSLRITQMLFAGMENVSNSKRLAKEAEADRLELIAQAENLALDVTEIYLETRKAEMEVWLTERHVKDHESILDDVKRLATNGYANEADVAQVSARLANARASFIAAQNNYQDQRASFMRMVGQPPQNLVDPIADSSLLPQDLESAMEWAKQYHPQIKAAVADSQAAQQEVRANQSGYYPKLYVEGVANTGDDIGGFEGKDEDYRLQLVMEWELFNGMRDVSRSRAANWRYNEALAIRDNAEQQLFEGTRFAWNAYQSLKQQEAFLRTSVDASTLAETGYITQFKLGRRSLLDLLNAKVEVFIARKRYLASQYDLTQASYRLMNATGRLGYGLRVSYPEEWQSDDPEPQEEDKSKANEPTNTEEQSS